MSGKLAWVAALWALAVAGVAGPGLAAEADEPGRLVSFGVESAREVPNDWIRAVVGVTEEDADAAQAADRVNQAMQWALDQARGAQGVVARSGGYSTQPVYHEGKLRRWRANQELVLESADADAMTALLGALQSRVQLRDFRFSVSDARRRSVEDELVAEALAAFRARALLVQRALDARGYAIDHVDIDTSGQIPPQPRMQMQMEAVSTSVAPPAAEPGTSRVSVQVRGAIALE
jgi:predicted secreted protein